MVSQIIFTKYTCIGLGNIELISNKYLFLLFCTFCGLFYFVNKISVVVAMNGNM